MIKKGKIPNIDGKCMKISKNEVLNMEFERRKSVVN